jgi:hypothetical protein
MPEGPPIYSFHSVPSRADRGYWNSLAQQLNCNEIQKKANDIVAIKLNSVTDAIRNAYLLNGNREPWEKINIGYRNALKWLTIAECIEDSGRFILHLCTAIQTICRCSSWINPAHVNDLRNSKGEPSGFDLSAGMLGWELANVYTMLGSCLPTDIQALLKKNIFARIITPFHNMISGICEKNWWFTTTNNWNAVCLACAAGCTFAVETDNKKLENIIAAVQEHIKSFISGFTFDGYCSEGIDYWNYGFGYFVMLSESIRCFTSGTIDLLDDSRIENIASYINRARISSSRYIAFSDCNRFPGPGVVLFNFLASRYQWPTKSHMTPEILVNNSSLHSFLAFAPTLLNEKKVSDTIPVMLSTRDSFPEAGVYILRNQNKKGLNMALKGGHNNEHHNHNDIGSFIITQNDQVIIADPGKEIYTNRTFGPHRYDSRVLNSYGHSVPVVANTLQATGREAFGLFIKTNFSETSDTLVLDLSKAYSVPGLKSLTRTYTYSRQMRGAITIIDNVAFSVPHEFETALMTFEQWRSISNNIIIIGSGENQLQVSISTNSQEFSISSECLKEDMPGKERPTRIALCLSQPVTTATITLSMFPL